MMNIDTRFMKRAIELARHGLGNTSPNPMVGAVIEHNGKIIGEGYHRRCGEGHAEVNAIASVKDKSLLTDSTIYVTLEPCSHYGKTPPCSKLIIDCGIPRVVVGSLDPFEKVSGRGVAMLREAGVEVVSGVLEDECRAINPVFMTAHTLHRPYVSLKWAQSMDGFIDRKRSYSESPTTFSSMLTATLTHRLRTLNDAIMVGSETVIADKPRLTSRLWQGSNPKRYAVDRRGRLNHESNYYSILGAEHGGDVKSYLSTLYKEGVTSLLVEGGSRLLQSFIDAGLWDYMRVETVHINLISGVLAPKVGCMPYSAQVIGDSVIYDYFNSKEEVVKIR